jgi:hypothetical protein
VKQDRAIFVKVWKQIAVAFDFAVALAFLVVIPSAASEPAVSRSLLMLPENASKNRKASFRCPTTFAAT